MPKTRDLSEFRRGLEAMHALFIERLDAQIINCKHGGSPLADALIRFKTQKAPTVAEVLASEVNASAAPGKLDLSAGLEPIPKEAAE